MNRVVATAFLAGLGVLAGACEAFEPPPTIPVSPAAPASGIQGTVLVGPVCDDPRAGIDCLVPYEARLVILDVQGVVAAQVDSDAEGHFMTILPPGSYTVAPVPGGDPYPTGVTLPVSIVEGAFTELEVRYESGLREGPGG